MDFESILRAAARGGPPMEKGAQVALLRAAAKRFADVPVFSVGQLITPVAGSPINGAGDPHLVIETRYEDPFEAIVEDSGTSSYGRLLHIRVLSVMRGQIAPFWVEASDFELYTGPTE